MRHPIEHKIGSLRLAATKPRDHRIGNKTLKIMQLID
jgi:hypothetical protein